jgi:hypothetical protein
MNLDRKQELKQELLKELREAYRRYAESRNGRNRNIKLPSALGIEPGRGGLLLSLNAEAVTSNMQTDAAAGEAWALVLRLWLGKERVPHVLLDWEEPRDVQDGHYQRFLYRVAQFRKLFPHWFDVADPGRLQGCKALLDSRLALNVASRKASDFSPRTTSREYRFESKLTASQQFAEHFGLDPDKVDRQFPVGLFAGAVNSKNRIFTGGKSAIDIVAVGHDKRFWLFELKAGKNMSVGTLSELMLYTGLMKAAAQSRIEFDEVPLDSRAHVNPADVKECTGVSAVMLVENPHPLLAHPELIRTLNAAASDHWNSELGAKAVSFSAARVVEIDDEVVVSDFEAADEASA